MMMHSTWQARSPSPDAEGRSQEAALQVSLPEAVEQQQQLSTESAPSCAVPSLCPPAAQAAGTAGAAAESGGPVEAKMPAQPTLHRSYPGVDNPCPPGSAAAGLAPGGGSVGGSSEAPGRRRDRSPTGLTDSPRAGVAAKLHDGRRTSSPRPYSSFNSHIQGLASIAGAPRGPQHKSLARSSDSVLFIYSHLAEVAAGARPGKKDAVAGQDMVREVGTAAVDAGGEPSGSQPDQEGGAAPSPSLSPHRPPPLPPVSREAEYRRTSFASAFRQLHSATFVKACNSGGCGCGAAGGGVCEAEVWV